MVDHPGALTSTSINGTNDFDEYVGVYDDAQGNYHGFEGKSMSPPLAPSTTASSLSESSSMVWA